MAEPVPEWTSTLCEWCRCDGDGAWDGGGELSDGDAEARREIDGRDVLVVAFRVELAGWNRGNGGGSGSVLMELCESLCLIRNGSGERSSVDLSVWPPDEGTEAAEDVDSSSGSIETGRIVDGP